MDIRSKLFQTYLASEEVAVRLKKTLIYKLFGRSIMHFLRHIAECNSVFPEIDADVQKWMYGRAHSSEFLSRLKFWCRVHFIAVEVHCEKSAEVIDICSFRMEFGRPINEHHNGIPRQPVFLIYH